MPWRWSPCGCCCELCYEACDWGRGCNISPKGMDWNLGGIYAHEIARGRPGLVAAAALDG
jgi:hypothetical protein